MDKGRRCGDSLCGSRWYSSSYTGRVAQFGPIYDTGATDNPIIWLQGAQVSLSITGHSFGMPATTTGPAIGGPWFFQYNNSQGVLTSVSTLAAIQLGDANGNGQIGHTKITNNVYQSNPNDTRSDPTLPPYGICSVFSGNGNFVKNKAFITVGSANLPLCTIYGNTGDGIIVVDGKVRTLSPNPPLGCCDGTTPVPCP